MGSDYSMIVLQMLFKQSEVLNKSLNNVLTKLRMNRLYNTKTFIFCIYHKLQLYFKIKVILHKKSDPNRIAFL